MELATHKIRLERVKELSPPLLETLCRHEAEAFGPGGLNAWLLPVVAEHGYLLLGRGPGPSNTLLASAALLATPRQGRSFLHAFYVLPAYRGQGIGRAFLAQVLAYVKEEGLGIVVLTVAPGNAPALALYRAGGFIVTASRPDYYGPGQERLFMEKRL